ncbi:MULTISPECIES: alpha-E domain-containing protein [unclassified Roseivivax]|uniref:alpha-E domain-containing protein n=1 Tax=Roseivivax sp. GX 12232 TaxID=2900547 RepID=UPI001E2A650C|nr:alpha-E domain-containing protein [Roseivivax sp. GX 12232]MCE0507187.1 alpha-E domain-containing protein [Roseivivax sp. GX 12232]
MLSRTASHLYWMARYIERAETTARLLQMGARNALLPDIGGGFRNDWEAVLQALGQLEAFREKYGDPVQRNVETFLFFDASNPASVMSCFSAARENGRVVRTALTSQVWDAINTTFQEMQALHRMERSKLIVNELADWTLRSGALIRGAIESTQLRNDGFRFMGLGHSIERGDNTARLLDVKYYVLLPSLSYVGSALDQSQWATLLRSMHAHRAFVWTYKGEITAAKIAHLLILNRQFPRSLLSATQATVDHLDALARGYGITPKATSLARGHLGELAEAHVEDIFDEGLHQFLLRFMGRNGEIAQAVQSSYLVGVPE